MLWSLLVYTIHDFTVHCWIESTMSMLYFKTCLLTIFLSEVTSNTDFFIKLINILGKNALERFLRLGRDFSADSLLKN